MKWVSIGVAGKKQHSRQRAIFGNDYGPPVKSGLPSKAEGPASGSTASRTTLRLHLAARAQRRGDLGKRGRCPPCPAASYTPTGPAHHTFRSQRPRQKSTPGSAGSKARVTVARNGVSGDPLRIGTSGPRQINTRVRQTRPAFPNGPRAGRDPHRSVQSPLALAGARLGSRSEAGLFAIGLENLPERAADMGLFSRDTGPVAPAGPLIPNGPDGLRRSFRPVPAGQLRPSK